ncbi:hypothetical protein E2C01_072263 [Portunus trituberculatus]|uniref:Uncharacterized protein n=1 Tax=Portunus trituberculatus TaxID=210409 RepID=A0A5B7I796_PORTR|nr:hypothetical protein [Portunus trituberculatus]
MESGRMKRSGGPTTVIMRHSGEEVAAVKISMWWEFCLVCGLRPAGPYRQKNRAPAAGKRSKNSLTRGLEGKGRMRVQERRKCRLFWILKRRSVTREGGRECLGLGTNREQK